MPIELRLVHEIRSKPGPSPWPIAVTSLPGAPEAAVSLGPGVLLVMAGDGSRWLQSMRFVVPPKVGALAVHPTLDVSAAIVNGAPRLLSRAGTILAERDYDPAWGDPKAVLFDRSGSRLFLSAETRSGHRVYLLDAASLEVLDEARLDGDRVGAHSLMLHPSRSVVAAEVACGQDGTWTTFLGERAGKLERVADTLAEEPTSVTFAPDGESVLGVSCGMIRRWSLPGLDRLASHVFPENTVTEYCVAAWRDSIVVPIADVDTNAWTLEFLDPHTLQPRATLRTPLRPPDVQTVGTLENGLLVTDATLDTDPLSPADREPRGIVRRLYMLVG